MDEYFNTGSFNEFSYKTSDDSTICCDPLEANYPPCFGEDESPVVDKNQETLALCDGAVTSHNSTYLSLLDGSECSSIKGDDESYPDSQLRGSTKLDDRNGALSEAGEDESPVVKNQETLALCDGSECSSMKGDDESYPDSQLRGCTKLDHPNGALSEAGKDESPVVKNQETLALCDGAECSSMKGNDESNTDSQLRGSTKLDHPNGALSEATNLKYPSSKETTNFDDITIGMPSIPVWSDDKIDEGDFEEYPELSAEQTIRLGEVMLVMVSLGPLCRVEEIVTALALNLRDPHDPSRRVFTKGDELGDRPVASGSPLYDIASPAVIQELEVLCEVRKFRPADQQGGNKRRKPSSEIYDCRSALREFLGVISGLEAEEKAAVFCFLAASLMKCGVKNRKAMGDLWSKSVPKLRFFYHGVLCVLSQDKEVPRLSRRAYGTLNKELRPGSKLLRTVLRPFLKKTFVPEVSDEVKGILQFTLLTHTSYTGMKMVSLTIKAEEILRYDVIKTLKKCDSPENRPGIIALLEYIFLYWDSSSIPKKGKFAPWCRMFDLKYWSNLSPKDHPSLATLLMCIIEDRQKDVWKMQSVKPMEECKTKCRETATKIKKEKVSDRLSGLFGKLMKIIENSKNCKNGVK